MPDQSKPERRSWLIPAAAVLVGIIAIVFVLVQAAGRDDGSSDDRADAATVKPQQSEWEYRDPDDPMAVGPVDAPLGMVVFTDFQCQYCAKWTHNTLPDLMSYVEAGKMRIEFRDMNIFGDESEQAARAAYAAGLQGKLSEYQAALFADGRPRPKEQLSAEALATLAAELKLDVPKFRTDYASPAVVTAVRSRASDGVTAGTYSTPAFILGGQPILGAQPTEVFVEKIDGMLAAAGK